MKLKLSAKSIFIILIVLIIMLLAFNYINRNSQLNSQKIQDIDPSKEGKTVGVTIEQNKPNGEKIKIIADLMEENKEKKLIKLINPITRIIKKNNVTKGVPTQTSVTIVAIKALFLYAKKLNGPSNIPSLIPIPDKIPK